MLATQREKDIARFLFNIEPEPMNGCWLWVGSRIRNTYGHFTIGSRTDGSRRQIYAHRFSYELYREAIPPGLTLDHLCRLPPCVNPWHLETVSMRENLLRGQGWSGRHAQRTSCPRGHLYDMIDLSAGRKIRRCSQCRRLQQNAASRRYKQRRYAENPEAERAHWRAAYHRKNRDQ